MRRFLILTLLILGFSLAGPSLAQEPDYDRINEIGEKLNCPTCAGINLTDCRTKTCEQWRDQIGDLVEEGYEDEEVLDYFVTRYGTEVLQEPPREGFTLILWILPFAALLIGGVWLFFLLRQWQNAPQSSGADTTYSETETDSDEYLSQVEDDLNL